MSEKKQQGKGTITSSIDSFAAARDWQKEAIEYMQAAVQISQSQRVKALISSALESASMAQAFFLMETNR